MTKGFFVLYGPPGGGKSVSCAQTFQGSLYVGSQKNILQFYKVWLKSPEGQASGLALPTREIILDTYALLDSKRVDAQGAMIPLMEPGPDGLALPVPQKQTLEKILVQAVRQSLMERASGQPLTYRNLVIDEAGTFWVRIFEEIAAQCVTPRGTLDGFRAYGEMGKWSRKFVDLLRQVVLADMNLVLVSHEADPDAQTGRKGGPKFVSKTIMGDLSAAADGVLMRDIEDLGENNGGLVIGGPTAEPEEAPAGPKQRRVWKAHASQHWVSKLRGLPDSMFDQIKVMELADILRLAGFEP